MRPVIGISAAIRDIGGDPHHCVGNAYVAPVLRAMHAIPFVVPSIDGWRDAAALLACVDGLLLTGDECKFDSTKLPLIRAAIDAELPILAIGHGMQQVNVALGGTLHARLRELPHRFNHDTPAGAPRHLRYAARHAVRFPRGGMLHGLTGLDRAGVNSLHESGIDRLGGGLVVDAQADDGTIEAIRLTGTATFVVGVQWHPEFAWSENRISLAIFDAFANAMWASRKRAGRRRPVHLPADVRST
jgi:putative glutamine amidotransferase